MLLTGALGAGNRAAAQLSGTITVPNATYPTLASAVSALNAQGVGAGGVIISVTAAQTAPVGGYLITATGTIANPIAITGSGNPTITAGLQTAGATNDAIFKISGGDYITLSNMTLTENAANVVTATAGTQTMTEAGIAIGRASTTNGAGNNTVSGCTITMRGTTTYTSAYGVYVTSRHDIGAADWTVAGTATAAGGENNNNTFTGNTISNVTGGFVLLGNNTLNDVGNRVGFAAGNGNTITMGANGYGSTLVVTLSGIGGSGDGVQAAGNSNFTASFNTITYPSGAVTGTLASQNGVFVTSSVNVANSVTNVTNNNITFNVQTPTVAGTNAQRGIYILGGVATGTANLNNNNITLNSAVGSNGACNGILNSIINNVLNMNGNMVMAGTYNGTGAVTYLSNTSTQTTSANINLNTFAGSTFSATAVGNLILISNSQGTPSVSVTGNATSGTTTRAATSGACTLYYNFGGPASGTETISNNNFSNFTFTAANTSAFYGIYTRTSPNQAKTVAGNTVSNISHGTSTGTIAPFYIDYLGSAGSVISGNTASNVTTASASLTGILMNASNSLGGLFQNNTVTGLSSTGASAVVQGMTASGSSAAGSFLKLTGNTISNLSATGTTAPAVYGITVVSGVIDTVEGNTITGLAVSATSGAGVVNGIRVTGSTNPVILRNRIYTLSTTATGATAAVVGINFASGTFSPAVVANNFISGLNATAAANNQAVEGINIIPTTTSTYQLYYNTIYLTPSASTATTFGAAGVSYPATGGTLDLRNNIINVNAAPVGTGVIAALQRASGTAGTLPANYAQTSNSNIFFAPNGAASFLYAEGTTTTTVVNTYNLTNDPAFNTSCGAYKTFMQGRDAATFTENNLSPAALAGTFIPTVSSYAQNNAQIVSGFSTDFSGVTRGVPADAGPLEFTSAALDAAGPSISYMAVAPTLLCTAPPTLTATIADATGVNATAGTRPRLYYKKSTEGNAFGGANNSTFNGWKWVEATGTTPSFSFTPDYTLLTGPVATGDVIQYFVVAQDMVGTPNVGTSIAAYPSGFCPTSVALPAAAGPIGTSPAPNSYTIGATPTAITASSSPDNLCVSGPVTLTLSAAAPGLTVQWQSATLTGAFSNIAGATTAPFTVTTVTATTRYRAIISCGTTIVTTTNEDTVIVQAPAVLSTSASASQCGGGIFTLNATGTTGATLNWYAAAAGGIPLGTGGTFTTPFINATTTYYVGAITGGGVQAFGKTTPTSTTGNSGFNDVGLMFNALTPFTLQSVDVYAMGTASTTGSVTVALKNAAGTTLQSATFNNVTVTTGGTVATTLPLGFAVPVGTNHRLVATAASGISNLIRESSTGFTYPYTLPGVASITSAYTGGASSAVFYYYFYNWQALTGCESPRTAVTATVTTPAVANVTASGSTAICQGSSVTLNASPTGASFNYQWLLNGAVIPGATSSSYVATQPGSYLVSVYTTPACNDTSNTPVVVTVSPVPVAVSPAGPFTLCQGGSQVITGPGGTGLTYQWLLNNAIIPGATSQTYSANATGNYRVRVTTSNSCSDTSQPVSVNVVAAPPATVSASGPLNICPNVGVVLSGPANSSLSYQWFLNGVAIAGATGQTYTALAAGQYTLRTQVTSASCSTFSSPVVVTTAPLPPTAFTASNGGNICAGSTVTLTGPVDLGYSYQWVLNGTPIAGATSQSYTTSVAGNYRLRVSSFASGCADTSGVIVLTARPLPAAFTAPAGAGTICSSTASTLTANAGSGFTYQWLFNTLPIVGANAQTYAANASGQYAVRVTSSFGCVNTSSPYTLTVRPQPPGQISYTNPLQFCAGGAVVLTAAGGIPGITYQYQWSRNGVVLPGTNAPFLQVTQAGSYTLRAQDSFGCLANSPAVVVTVNPTPAVTITASGPVLSATPAFYQQYQWFLNNVAIPGANGPTYTATQNGSYRVEVVDGNSCLGLSTTIYLSTAGIAGAASTSAPILVYPNPTSSVLRIEAPLAVNAYLRNSLGQTVLVQKDAMSLDVTRFPDGLYTLTLTDGSGNVVYQEKVSKMTR